MTINTRSRGRGRARALRAAAPALAVAGCLLAAGCTPLPGGAGGTPTGTPTPSTSAPPTSPSPTTASPTTAPPTTAPPTTPPPSSTPTPSPTPTSSPTPTGGPPRVPVNCPALVSGPPAAVPIRPRGPAPQAPFLVDPDSQAAQQARSNPASAAAINRLVTTPTAFPVGDWISDVTTEVRTRADEARAARATAVFMIFAIPHRDSGGAYSTGGFATAAAYRAFTRQVAAGIGDARAVVILEPDSLGQIDTLTPAQQAERYGLLNDAVDVYGALPSTDVYLDGANCGWTSAPLIAQRLLLAGLARARGFAVNVSNYYLTSDEVLRGDAISGLTGGAHFVVDTSRNGRGALSGITNPWCNPPGRGLGPAPATATSDPLADAFLWIKTPGASDGECGRGNPPAGTWWEARAEELVRNAV
jgi:endoglucanase